jgi:hypothetical protein
MNSEDKSKLLGMFFWLFTAFNVLILGVMAIFFFVFFGAMISQMPHKANDPPPEFFIGLFSFIFFLILITTILFSIPKVVAGYGLRNHKPWARTWAIVASVMCCMSFPIGTAIGVFGLVFVFSDEGKQYFDDLSYGRLASAGRGAIAPPPNSWQ